MVDEDYCASYVLEPMLSVVEFLLLKPPTAHAVELPNHPASYTDD